MNPLVSIIMPTYNRAYILGMAIKSVLAQTYQNCELIIVDDGSTDNTKELVESFRDPKIRYIKIENGGPSGARNHALKIAKGEWIAFLDSDNELYPDYLQTMVSKFGKNANAKYGIPKVKRTRELYENGVMTQCIDDSAKNYPDSLPLSYVFLRKVKFDLNGFFHHRIITDAGICFDPAFSKCEDWDYFFQIGDRFPDDFLYVPQTLLNYHQRFGTDGLVGNSTYRDWAVMHEMLYQKNKSSKMLAGQTWYPERVEHWNKMADDFEKGLILPFSLYYFQKKDDKK